MARDWVNGSEWDGQSRLECEGYRSCRIQERLVSEGMLIRNCCLLREVGIVYQWEMSGREDEWAGGLRRELARWRELKNQLRTCLLSLDALSDRL